MTLYICLQKTIFFGIGGVFFVVGLMMACLWPVIYNNVLRTQLAISEKSKTFEMWSETPIPMYIDIYLFNWTNHERTLKYKEKPILQQVGPYVFSEHRSKVDIKWEDDATMFYHNRHRWNFHPELSNGNLTDNVTNLNVVLMTIGKMCSKLSLIEKTIVNAILKIEDSIVIKKSVDELLFTGFDDNVLKIMNTLSKRFPKLFPASPDKFGWFYKRNMSTTADGLFQMHTGVDNLSELGNVVTWNGHSKLNFYKGHCQEIKGSLGELWAPPSEDHITLFATDICSAINMQYSSEVRMHNLTGKSFVGGEDVFDNGTRHASSACYCMNANTCPRSGVRDVSGCRDGAPVFISFPHFYLADPYYSSAVDGLAPNADNHSFAITLEKFSGVPLMVNARLQINILMEPVADMNVFKNLPQIYMPMMWFHQHAEMTPELAANLTPLAELGAMGLWALMALTAVGLSLIIIGLVLNIRRHKREDALNTIDPAPWQT
ncbi:protein croquemort isoform X3 [Nilaparvata lugens]|nr:protein croquemort isoform X3 [Nilaparvata lugens]XP_039283749.1 protein croquemort isoform X4 [Nilaparvata lugens]XP_039283750.1 protein croquemort isoform X3 [Nilaparvata lugens]